MPSADSTGLVGIAVAGAAGAQPADDRPGRPPASRATIIVRPPRDGLEDQPPAVGGQRRVVGRLRVARVALRAVDLRRVVAGEVAEHRPDPPVALGEVLVAGRRLVGDRARRRRRSSGCRPSTGSGRCGRRWRDAADQRGGARVEVGAQHRDLAELDRERQLLAVGLVGDDAPVARDRRVRRVVARLVDQRAEMRQRRAVVARLVQPPRQLGELAAQQHPRLRAADVALADAGRDPLAQHGDRLALHEAGRAAVQAADRQRAELAPAQARNAASVTPKISGAALGIANWCSEWKNRCWARWPCVMRRTARRSSSARERRARARRARRPGARPGARVGVAVACGEAASVRWSSRSCFQSSPRVMCSTAVEALSS